MTKSSKDTFLRYILLDKWCVPVLYWSYEFLIDTFCIWMIQMMKALMP